MNIFIIASFLSFFVNNAAAISSLVGILTGGSVVAAYLKWATFYNSSQDEFRDELRVEMKELRDRVDKYRDELSDARDEMLQMKEQLIVTKTENDKLRHQINILIQYLNNERMMNDKNKINYQDIFHEHNISSHSKISIARNDDVGG